MNVSNIFCRVVIFNIAYNNGGCSQIATSVSLYHYEAQTATLIQAK